MPVIITRAQENQQTLMKRRVGTVGRNKPKLHLSDTSVHRVKGVVGLTRVVSVDSHCFDQARAQAVPRFGDCR